MFDPPLVYNDGKFTFTRTVPPSLLAAEQELDKKTGRSWDSIMESLGWHKECDTDPAHLRSLYVEVWSRADEFTGQRIYYAQAWNFLFCLWHTIFTVEDWPEFYIRFVIPITHAAVSITKRDFEECGVQNKFDVLST